MTIDNELITNRTFDEIKVGDCASLTRQLTPRDIDLFAAMSGDVNPAHVDPAFAQSDQFHKVIAHGMWGGALISTLLGTELPGPGTIYLDQSIHFLKPIGLGDSVTVMVTAREKDEEHHHITFDCCCINQNGDKVIEGEALVLAPESKISRPRMKVLDVALRTESKGAKFRRLIAKAAELDPIPTAVVHPVDANSLGGAVAAAQKRLITPVLIGPEHKIRAAAEAAKLDISPYRLLATEHSDAAAAKAVELVLRSEVRALMKGSLHTDEFIRPILRAELGLRTGRRMSHVFVLDVQDFDRPLFMTDCALNVLPKLLDKRDIIQNAIDMAHALGIEQPKVAILSAVETVTPKIPSTVDAAALCKMADRKQITGAIVDGPLAFDNAISIDAAKAKNIQSDVAGRADILVVPDVEAGNMLAKQWEYLAGAEAAGVVIGARVPIILTSRSDSVQSRLASSAIAALIEDYKQRGGS